MKNNIVKVVFKSIITISSMVATNDLLGYYAPSRCSQTIHRIGNNIAGLSIGYLVGKKAADLCVDAIDRAIEAYNRKENNDG